MWEIDTTNALNEEKQTKKRGGKTKQQNKRKQICQPTAIDCQKKDGTKLVKKSLKNRQQTQKETGRKKITIKSPRITETEGRTAKNP